MLNLSEPAAKIAAKVDCWLAARAGRGRGTSAVATLQRWQARHVDTPVGPVRVVDTALGARCVVIVPDGPNVIEHYTSLIERLSPSVRVVCFDMPGFGFSWPRSDYGHSLDEGARVVLGVLDALQVERATLAFSCANGLYALRAARLFPERVASLFLSQTPGLTAMQDWAARVIPVPLRVPVLGQAAAWWTRRHLAERWYAMALPRGTDRETFRAPARAALRAGGCFSLAGVVQGLSAESQEKLEGIRIACTVLWGERDSTHVDSAASSLRTCVADAQILRCEGIGHFPDLEQPERFSELLLARLEAHA